MILKTLSVTEVNNYLKKITDNDFILNNLKVKGEVSNYKIHSSGHIYFSLKDENSKVNCVIFKGDAVNVSPTIKDGTKVEVRGRLSVYTRDGSYQVYCKEINEYGVGDLHAQFEQLKKQLFSEGLFDEKYKKPIPYLPKAIGVITSETGAALRDIINVLRRRSPYVDIMVYPSLVQGKDAPASLINGIRYFNREKNVDVIIIIRGGGSIEELWAFNDKNLAYEIFKSKLPVISGVGHEIDFTITDFVSDLRAPTPSAAAEVAAPKLEELNNNLSRHKAYLDQFISTRMINEKEKINYISRILENNSPRNMIINRYRDIDSIKDKLTNIMMKKIENNRSNLININNMLTLLNPINVLNKGYAIIEDNNGNVIQNIDKLKALDEVNVKMKDGSADFKIEPKR
ncbi:exodeoxyribonuclease VII large subunit [Clostridium manihotivorum]|uniref:Exodeoxyribonuclease 7 large subunit n=1 Tax=Clostridium manihotivorum TaxID=2320868 RepID=A0A3R5U8S4_9CLOT|nr:exodeoxyribonuclease VII large subunit [Clostridium manihotivorum]QAA32069.1 exodeoxyribonuclease VII large subunit [Clostridium manihotivorum]